MTGEWSSPTTAPARTAGAVIRVVVVDDQALVRAGFSVLLRTAEDIEVVGEAGEGAEAVEVVIHERPDVVLMDIRMPGTDGLEATRRITADERLAHTKVLVLSTFDLDEYVFQAIRAGASGFLLKETLPDDLLAAVRSWPAGRPSSPPASPAACSRSSSAGPQPAPSSPRPGSTR